MISADQCWKKNVTRVSFLFLPCGVTIYSCVSIAEQTTAKSYLFVKQVTASYLAYIIINLRERRHTIP